MEWDFFLAHAGADSPAAERLRSLLEPRATVFEDSMLLGPRRRTGSPTPVWSVIRLRGTASDHEVSSSARSASYTAGLMAGMLYYPFIQAPRPVLVRALLYSDSLSTIVPEVASQEAIDALPAVVRERMPDFYSPVSFLDSGDVHDAWSSPLSGDETETVLDVLERTLHDLPSDDLLIPADAPMSMTMLLTSKIGLSLALRLKRRGVAELIGTRAVRVSATVQHLVLSVMASYISELRPDLRPHTDRVSAHQLATAHRHEDLQWCGVVDLGELFPVPDPDTSLESIVAFRQRYDDERRRLMAGVDRLVAELKRAAPDREALLRDLADEVAAAIRDFRHAGGRFRWRRQSLAALIGLGTAAGGQYLSPDWSWLSLFVSAVGVNLATTRPRLSTNSRIDVAYLHNVRKVINRS
ncbi:hypothetical protein ACIQMJ_27210 [Actinosynnema sp. NPDC091369]